MRIVLDGRYMRDDFPGIGRYTFHLAHALGESGEGDELLVLHDPAAASSRFDLALLGRLPGVRLVPCAVARFAPAEQCLLPGVARRLAPELWHAPFYVKPWLLPVPSVVTIFDVVPMDGAGPRARLHREAGRMAARTSRRVLTGTRAARDAILSRLGLAETQVRVTPLAAAPAFRPATKAEIEDVRSRFGLGEGYVLHVSSGLPHKNVPRLLEAWRRACEGGDLARRHELALVGPSFGSPRPGVRGLGRVSDRDLPALYSGAALVVLPSLEEGFGLPLLEAMACGAPVACADIPSLAEVAGDAARRFAPLDVPAIARASLELLEDAEARAELGARGRARSAGFAWSRTAAATRAAYREALDR